MAPARCAGRSRPRAQASPSPPSETLATSPPTLPSGRIKVCSLTLRATRQGSAALKSMSFASRPLAPAPQTKVVPIRPGALDAAASRDGAPSGSVELSTSERDAFREIARALVGRTPAARDDRPSEANPVAEARDLLDHAFAAPFAPPPEGPPSASGAADDETVRRNAGAMLDRLPIGLLVARDARTLYLNRTLLDLLGYRDLPHFQAADGLAAIFRGRDPQSMPPPEGDSLRIVKSDGHSLAAEGHAQSIIWDDGPATLFTLRRSPEAATDSHGSERVTHTRNGAAGRASGDAGPRDRRGDDARFGGADRVDQPLGRATVRLQSERDRGRKRADAASAALPCECDGQPRRPQRRRRSRSAGPRVAGRRARQKRRRAGFGSDVGADRIARSAGLLRPMARSDPRARGRTAPHSGPRRRAGGERAQDRIPRQGQPRDPYAAACASRHGGSDDGRALRADRERALQGLSQGHSRVRPLCDEPRRRSARLEQDRIRANSSSHSRRSTPTS